MPTENPNANYDHILDTGKKSFPVVYEEAMETLASQFELESGLREMLRKKRAFGLEKYGERAFQSTFENAISSPVAAHLGDELIDAFNYALHGYYIANMQLRSVEAKRYERIIDALRDVLLHLASLREALTNELQQEALEWTSLR